MNESDRKLSRWRADAEVCADACCHVNGLGCELMLDAMMQAIDREGCERR